MNKIYIVINLILIMGIMQDSGEILIFAYKNYLKNEETSIEEIQELTKWDINRIKRSLDYLKKLSTIEARKSLGGNGNITKLLPHGIILIENDDEEEFKQTFGFEVNLGLFKFSITESN